MTQTNSIAAKFSVTFVAIAMAFAFFAPATQAADLSEMSLDELIALVNQLQAGSGSSDSSGSMMSSSCDSIPAPLTIGAQNANVTALQNFLMGAGQVIPAGATGYFGGQTQSALAGWQAANGVSPAVGYYGPITKAAIDAKCVPTTDGGSDSEGGSDEPASEDEELKGGETDINSVDTRGDEDEVAEGEEDVPVLEIEFDVEDADARLERIDVTFDNSAIGTDGENDPWDAFDEVSVWIDGEKVASEDATDEDDWDEDGSEFTFRISQIDTKFEEDDSAEVIIAVSAQGGVDVDGDAGEDDWDIFLPADGLRFTDGEGIDTEVPSSDQTAETFEIIEEGDNDDLDLQSSDDDPESTTLEVDADDKMEHAIFAFELDADDSDNDVELDNLISVEVNVGGTDGTSVDNFVNDFRLEIDGESFEAESYTGTGVMATIDFDIDGDVTIDAEEKVTAMLYAEFEDVGDSFSDATITASTSPAMIDAEGADDITVDGSSVVGDVHTVRSDGVDVDLVDETTSIKENDDTDPSDDEGVFEIEFDVTAFGDDVYIPLGSSSTTDLTVGFEWSILDDSNAAVATGVAVPSVDVEDGGAEEDNSYKVAEGSTETFTLTVEYDPAASGSFKLRLDTINFAASDVATATNSQDVSDEDIDTGKETI